MEMTVSEVAGIQAIMTSFSFMASEAGRRDLTVSHVEITDSNGDCIGLVECDAQGEVVFLPKDIS